MNHKKTAIGNTPRLALTALSILVLAGTVVCGRPDLQTNEPRELVKKLGSSQAELQELSSQYAERLAELHSAEVLPDLINLIRDASAPKKKVLIIALGGYRSGAAEVALGLLAKDREPSVRAAAITQIGRTFGESAMLSLRRALSDPNESVRFAAITELASLASMDTAELLMEQLSSPSDLIRGAALDALQSYGLTVPVITLSKMLNSETPFSAKAAVRHLANSPPAPELEAKLFALTRSKFLVDYELYPALALAGSVRSIPYIANGLKFSGPFVIQAFRALAKLDAKAYLQIAENKLRGEKADDRVGAATLILSMSTSETARKVAINTLESEIAGEFDLAAIYAVRALAEKLTDDQLRSRLERWFDATTVRRERWRAAAGLRFCRSRSLVPRLREIHQAERDETVKTELLIALAWLGDYSFVLTQLDPMGEPIGKKRNLSVFCARQLLKQQSIRR